MEKSIEIINKLDEMDNIAAFIEDVGESIGMSPSLVMSLNLALEEAIANVVMYAYPNEEGKHKIILNAVFENGELVFTLIDSGVPFDPTKAPEADITLSAQDRPIGGLGIFLIRKIMNEISYQRVNNENHLIMKKRISE
jgi:anti-sigma regulatory factor (Ser/Thr protein kinase)